MERTELSDVVYKLESVLWTLIEYSIQPDAVAADWARETEKLVKGQLDKIQA